MPRRSLPAWLVFLLVAGAMSALFWTFLLPIVEPVDVGFLKMDWVFFRPVWKAWGGRIARDWFTTEAGISILAGACAAFLFRERVRGRERPD